LGVVVVRRYTDTETQLIAAADLSFSYGETPVLSGVSFSVERQRFVSFIGPSGCGKTTLLHVLAGIYPHQTGRLDVYTDNISFVFQHDSLLEWRTAVSNVLLPFELQNVPVTDAVRDKARHMLSLVGLDGFDEHLPHELSGGMKKRVEIARALVTDPELLILDEPFSSLDIMTRERLNVLVKQIQRIQKTTIVLVTHSVEEACFLSDTVYVLSNQPAQIIQTRRIPEKESSIEDRFLLTSAEHQVEHEIREQAKSLWTADNQPVRSSHGAGAFDRPGAAVERARKWAKRNYNLLLIPMELVAVYFILVFVKRQFSVPDYIFPHPGAILGRFFSTLADGSILPDLRMTVYESLSGFLIALGITLVLGYVIAKSRLLSNLLMPYLVAANTVPSVALAPFLVLWFGFGLAPKIITSVIVVFFPMLISNISAIRIAQDECRDLVNFYRPGALKTFAKFELPAALPVIFSGIKVSITLSVIGAVVGEFVSGHEGLGSLVRTAKANFDMELMFVGLIWLIITGLTYYGLASGLFLYLISKRKTQTKE
jgi:NitT/TauT family transport system ATP-binding protein